jgi:hypothetical protein
VLAVVVLAEKRRKKKKKRKILGFLVGNISASGS